MSRRIDYDSAKTLLLDAFQTAEKAFADDHRLTIDAPLVTPFDIIFASPTQAYREVLIGCILVRILDKEADVTLPYASQGDQAFNGRSLDESVVNPFLKENEIPSSKGPYLNVFRRQVQFDESTRDGVRDKSGYDALLSILKGIKRSSSNTRLERLLEYALYRFVLLREEAVIPLARIQRISLPQYQRLLDMLLQTPSGGLLPVLILESMLQTINEAFSLAWTVDVQGINVSDRSTQAGGDIVIRKNGVVLMAVEVTERPVDEARVVSTFRTKIAPAGIADYVFMVNLRSIPEDALRQAEKYFAQGNEVSFVDIRIWAYNTLVTVGQSGRLIFNKHLQESLSRPDIPSQIKVAWNSAIADITSA